MVAKLRLDRAEAGTDVAREDDLIELLDHLAGAKLTEVATGLARWTGRVRLGDLTEVSAGVDLLLEVEAVLLGRDEDVSGMGADHRGLL